MATTRRALLVIDVQESFRKRETWPSWGTVSRPEIAETVDRLVRAARERGEPVFWVLHEEPGTGGPFDPVNDLIRPIPPLAPAEGEQVLRKTSHNAFTTTDLARTLTLGGITELAVCGIRTEQCCETTARVASDLGYRVDYVVDATATNPIPAPGADLTRPEEEILADPETLGVREIEERTVRALHGRFAEVITAEDYIAGPDRA
ncbi:cysteine hydrolase family protein [Nocardiopsis potens]|uniref:cysteine hydrolase family protein n=1 Tax=Nocardiopsis potens TaxID=1246458 RepID=UPI00034D1DEF|nr:isochorismatase family protein [Nocardiopsis potens]